MTLIGAEFYIEVHGILADQEVLGRSLQVIRNQEKFRIDLPASPDSFHFMHAGPPRADDSTVDPRQYAPTTAVLNPTGSIVEIRLVRVVVNVEASLSVYSYDHTVEAHRRLYDELFYGLRSRATDVAGELCERLKLELGQHWIEPAGRYPRVVNMAGLIDLEAGKTFGQVVGSAGEILVVDPDVVLDASSLLRLQEKLIGGPPQADELLLAEAKHLVKGGQPVAFDRATLLAAIAVELRTKRLLRSLAYPDRVEMLELLINNPNDWTMAAHGLFLKTLPVMLRQDHLGPEHKALAKRLQRLFVSRNAIAHKGASVTNEAAIQHVETAWEAFKFMSGLPVLEDDTTEVQAP